MIIVNKRLPGNTVELTITIPWKVIKSTYNKIHDELISNVELSGFRKGKAPKELAEKQLDKTKIYEEVLKEMVPHVYADTVKQENLHPIISPRIQVLVADINQDWKIRAETCEAPEITLGKYQEAVTKLKQAKGKKIWTPQDKSSADQKKPEITVGELLDALYTEIKVDLSHLILEQEVNRMLSRLVDELAKLGLSVEQYLTSHGKTSEILRKEYEDEAQKTLSLEFALEKIADNEKVTIENAEIDAVIKAAKTPSEQSGLEKQRYYIGSLLRRQKTLQKLLEPAIISV